MQLWENPEFIRHQRADLRPARMLGIGALVLLACALTALGSWGSVAKMETGRLQEFGQSLYGVIASLGFGVLCLWSFFGCLQSVVRERELKTFDFQRTTSLTSTELMVGKLFGAPVVAWFIFLCCTPAVLIGALLAAMPLEKVIATYVLLIAFAIFLGLAGLWISMRMERQKTGAAVFGVIFLLYFVSIAQSPYLLRYSSVPGFYGFSPFVALMQLYGTGAETWEFRPTFFGVPVDWYWISIGLYISFGAWLVLMLRRNLKRDYADLRLLSGWQAVGSALFVNAVLFAFMRSPSAAVKGTPYGPHLDDRYEIAIILNVLLFYWVGMVTLPSQERLKVWARTPGAYLAKLLSEDGPVWPWMVLSFAVGLLCLSAYVFGGELSQPDWRLRKAAAILLLILIYACRDVLFMQWCTVTHMRRPVVKGAMLLIVYYVSAIVIAASTGAFSDAWAARLFALLMPFSAFTDHADIFYSIAGAILQLLIIAVLLNGITQRLRRSASIAAARAAAA